MPAAREEGFGAPAPLPYMVVTPEACSTLRSPMRTDDHRGLDTWNG